MAYKCSFLDNMVYNAQDVNDIFARISNGGVVFTDTGYTLGDLNDTQSRAVGEGVTRDENSCRVVFEDGVYKISKGVCFMNDGTAIIFDASGQEIEIIPEVTNYVYLYRNAVGNSIDIVVSEYKGDENSIPLAEIDKKGIIHDRRKYARAKVDASICGNIKNFTVNLTECKVSTSETVTVDMGSGDFYYLIMWDGESVYGSSTEVRVADNKNLIELVEGEEVALSIGKRAGYHNEYLYCMKDGQKLHIYLSGPIPNGEYTLNLGVV